MLALFDERHVGVRRNCRVEIEPAAAGRARNPASGSRIAAQLCNQVAQLRCGSRTAPCVTCKQLLQLIVASVLGAHRESLVTVLGNRQQLAEGYDDVTVVHGSPLVVGLRSIAPAACFVFGMRYSMQCTRV